MPKLSVDELEKISTRVVVDLMVGENLSYAEMITITAMMTSFIGY